MSPAKLYGGLTSSCYCLLKSTNTPDGVLVAILDVNPGRDLEDANCHVCQNACLAHLLLTILCCLEPMNQYLFGISGIGT